MTATKAVVLLGHGSRHTQARPVLEQLAASLSLELGLPVAVAVIELDTPDVAGAITNLKATNPQLQQVTVLPLLFTTNYHRRVDVPKQIATARQAHPWCEISLGGTLHAPQLLELLAQLFAGYDRSAQKVLYAAGRPKLLASQLSEILGEPVWWTNQKTQVEAWLQQGLKLAIQPLFVAPGLLLDQLYESASGKPQVQLGAHLGTQLVAVLQAALTVRAAQAA